MSVASKAAISRWQSRWLHKIHSVFNFSQVPFHVLGEHQQVCAYRLVLCPGSNDHCHEMVPFCQVEEHGKMCEDISQWKNYSEESRTFWLPETMVAMLF